MKKLSLQWKITLLVGIITAAACLGVTLNSVFSAPVYYAQILEEGLAEVDSALRSDGEIYLPDGEDRTALDLPAYYRDLTRLFSVQSLLVMVAIVAVSLGVTYFVTGRVLRPLKDLNRSVKEIGGENLHRRVELPKGEDEVRELTGSFNAMLGRLEDAFLVQKNFAANAAHELKTPLAVMKTSLQVLELDEEPSPEDYQEFREDVAAGLERLTGTVDNLMALANDSVENLEPVELRELVDQAGKALRERAKEKGITVSVEGKAPPVLGNRILLYRVFFNLMENAVKYNREGGEVRAELSEQDGGAWVEISDTGMGIPAESLHHIFEPFYRADRSRSQRIPGAGLGLSIVRTVLDRCGGTIKVDSVEGKGTAIRVFLPKAES